MLDTNIKDVLDVVVRDIVLMEESNAVNQSFHIHPRPVLDKGVKNASLADHLNLNDPKNRQKGAEEGRTSGMPTGIKDGQ